MSTRHRVLIGVVGAVVLLFVVAGVAAGGVSGGARSCWASPALLLGIGAAVAGRARWAFIASRRIGGVVRGRRRGRADRSAGSRHARPRRRPSSSEVPADADHLGRAGLGGGRAAAAAEAAEAALGPGRDRREGRPADGPSARRRAADRRRRPGRPSQRPPGRRRWPRWPPSRSRAARRAPATTATSSAPAGWTSTATAATPATTSSPAT